MPTDVSFPAPSSLTEIIDDVLSICKAPIVSPGDLVKAFGTIGDSPLISIQLVIRRKHLWLPGLLVRRQLAIQPVSTGLAWLRPGAVWLDRHSRGRWSWLSIRPLIVILQLACALCGIAIPFSELLPFSLLTARCRDLSIGFVDDYPRWRLRIKHIGTDFSSHLSDQSILGLVYGHHF